METTMLIRAVLHRMAVVLDAGCVRRLPVSGHSPVSFFSTSARFAWWPWSPAKHGLPKAG